MLFALDKSLITCICAGIVVEHQRGYHTPAREVIHRVGADLRHRNLRAVAVLILFDNIKFERFGHYETQPKAKRVGRLNIFIVAMYAHLAYEFSGGDCYVVREQAVVITLDGVAAFIDYLDTECAVVVASHRGGYCHRKVLLIFEYDVGR